jgi:hypothetical protein
MKSIPYLISGFAWFLIFNAFVQIYAMVSAGAIFFSIFLAFIASGWLLYRSETKDNE